MEILAVVIGYLLGIAPFVVPKIIERTIAIRNSKIAEQEKEEREELFDEWLNGKKEEPINEPRKVDQQSIYEEYITGEVKGE